MSVELFDDFFGGRVSGYIGHGAIMSKAGGATRDETNHQRPVVHSYYPRLKNLEFEVDHVFWQILMKSVGAERLNRRAPSTLRFRSKPHE
jgi:hypothetical protein